MTHRQNVQIAMPKWSRNLWRMQRLHRSATFVLTLTALLAGACEDMLGGEVNPAGAPALARPEGPQPTRATPQRVTALGLQPRANGTYDYLQSAGHFSARIHNDGSITFTDQTNVKELNPLDGGLRFGGLSDWSSRSETMRHAAEKRALFRDTRELRRDMALREHRERIEAGLNLLHEDLASVWTRRGRSPGERKEQLFQRWDECSEPDRTVDRDPPTPTGENVAHWRSKAGEQARRTIESFIRQHAPPGSPYAYTDLELEAMNARRESEQRFAPYATTSPRRPPPP
ncbi:MAG: hypothetical protein V3V08_05105 [Nannocystaceae bacterium]